MTDLRPLQGLLPEGEKDLLEGFTPDRKEGGTARMADGS